jgi:hypothetical protein
LEQPSVGLGLVRPIDVDVLPDGSAMAVSNFWRRRRTPAERAAKLFRLSDQYTPTPCRWKLCASIFKDGFQR